MVGVTISNSSYPNNWIALDIPLENMPEQGMFQLDSGKEARLDEDHVGIIDPSKITFYYCNNCGRGYERSPNAKICMVEGQTSEMIAHEEEITGYAAMVARIYTYCRKCGEKILSIPISKDQKIPKNLEHLILK